MKNDEDKGKQISSNIVSEDNSGNATSQKRAEAFRHQIQFFEDRNANGTYDAILEYLREEYHMVQKNVATKENLERSK